MSAVVPKRFTIFADQVDFLENHAAQFGYKDQSSLVREAIGLFIAGLKRKWMEKQLCEAAQKAVDYYQNDSCSCELTALDGEPFYESK